MATKIERGESLFIPFKNGKSILDSQLKPRMYKSVQNFEKTFPKHNYGTQNIELVEYSEVKHGEWKHTVEEGQVFNHHYWTCSLCGASAFTSGYEKYCHECGAIMDGRSDT